MGCASLRGQSGARDIGTDRRGGVVHGAQRTRSFLELSRNGRDRPVLHRDVCDGVLSREPASLRTASIVSQGTAFHLAPTLGPAGTALHPPPIPPSSLAP